MPLFGGNKTWILRYIVCWKCRKRWYYDAGEAKPGIVELVLRVDIIGFINSSFFNGEARSHAKIYAKYRLRSL